MRTTVLPTLTLSAALMLAAFNVHADEQPARPAERNIATSATSATSTASAASTTAVAKTAAAPGLTRAQVLEDLKRYQREHANPSYEELIFLR